MFTSHLHLRIKELEQCNENLERTNTGLSGRVAALYGENQRLINDNTDLQAEVDHLRSHIAMLGMGIGTKKVDKDTKLNKELYEFNKGFKKRELKIEIKNKCPRCWNESSIFECVKDSDRIICPVCNINFHPSMLK